MRRKRKTAPKSSFLRGFTTLGLLIIVVIIGGILLAGGIFPKEPRGGGGPEAVPEPAEFSKDLQLQLQTLKFKECSSTAAVDFLVDNSGSMRGSKLRDLQNGLKVFASSFPDEGIIGLQVYSSPGATGSTGYRELVPISRFADVKANFDNAVNGMRANGFTHSRDAMEFAKTRLDAALPQYPDKQFNLVFISDGIPETGATDLACPGGNAGGICQQEPNGCRCFASEQDPTEAANQIKAQGVRVFTIAYLDQGDARLNDLLQNLMRNVATTPEDYYVAPVSNQIQQILGQIAQKLCE